MTKREYNKSGKRFVWLGVLMVGVGISILFRATDGSQWQEMSKLFNSVCCILLGVMQFYVARLFFKKAREAQD